MTMDDSELRGDTVMTNAGVLQIVRAAAPRALLIQQADSQSTQSPASGSFRTEVG